MGSVRVQVEFRGKSYEVEDLIREETNISGGWLGDDWEAVLNKAVRSIAASVKAGEESG